MASTLYERLFPLARVVSVETAHRLGMWTMRLPLPLGGPVARDSFRWRGLTLRNRVGIAAGFDKNGEVLRGVDGLGAGFLEVGTIVTEPYPGNPAPRMDRVAEARAVWNRLGFPSDGIARIRGRIEAFRASAPGLELFCNIAPHPTTVRGATDAQTFFQTARAELKTLVRALHASTPLFVINLSSPNTPGLRGLLYGDAFAQELVAPTKALLAELDREAGRGEATALLVKLPPEDADQTPWNEDTLAPVAGPLADLEICDGWVAVNTSIGLSKRLRATEDDLPGGISGAPLLPLALNAIGLLDAMRREGQLLVGVGGVFTGEDAVRLVEAGADLVEVYSGMIYRGPTMVGECARALAAAR